MFAVHHHIFCHLHIIFLKSNNFQGKFWHYNKKSRYKLTKYENGHQVINKTEKTFTVLAARQSTEKIAGMIMIYMSDAQLSQYREQHKQ